MNTFADYLCEAEERRADIAQAEQYRSCLKAPKRRSSLSKRLQPLLVALGELLVTWGDRLQASGATRSVYRD